MLIPFSGLFRAVVCGYVVSGDIKHYPLSSVSEAATNPPTSQPITLLKYNNLSLYPLYSALLYSIGTINIRVFNTAMTFQGT